MVYVLNDKEVVDFCFDIQNKEYVVLVCHIVVLRCSQCSCEVGVIKTLNVEVVVGCIWDI